MIGKFSQTPGKSAKKKRKAFDFEATEHQMSQTFSCFQSQNRNCQAGQRYRNNPRMGAGSLGPNYT